MSKSKNLKILQVSDCHVAADGDADYRGLNAESRLVSLLLAMRAWDPDLVLLTGDVSEDGSAASYARVAVRLGTVGAPVLALPGNHDDPQVMQRYFSSGPWAGPCSVPMEGWQLIALDSTQPGRIDGSFSQQQLEELDACLRASDAEHVLVALHHQPVPVNSPWIDRYALQHPDRFLNYLDRDARVRCVVWGHIHHAFESRRNGVELLGAPSSVANSLPEKSKFTLDLTGPSCRWLVLNDNGKVESGVLRPLQSSSGNTSHSIR